MVGNLIPLCPLKPRRPDLALVIDLKSGRPCKIYTTGNLGPKKRDPNQQGTSRGTIGKLPSGILPVAQVSGSLAATVGARPLDAIDRTLVAGKPSLKFRPSRTKDK